MPVAFKPIHLSTSPGRASTRSSARLRASIGKPIGMGATAEGAAAALAAWAGPGRRRDVELCRHRRHAYSSSGPELPQAPRRGRRCRGVNSLSRRRFPNAAAAAATTPSSKTAAGFSTPPGGLRLRPRRQATGPVRPRLQRRLPTPRAPGPVAPAVLGDDRSLGRKPWPSNASLPTFPNMRAGGGAGCCFSPSTSPAAATMGAPPICPGRIPCSARPPSSTGSAGASPRHGGKKLAGVVLLMLIEPGSQNFSRGIPGAVQANCWGPALGRQLPRSVLLIHGDSHNHRALTSRCAHSGGPGQFHPPPKPTATPSWAGSRWTSTATPRPFRFEANPWPPGRPRGRPAEQMKAPVWRPGRAKRPTSPKRSRGRAAAPGGKTSFHAPYTDSPSNRSTLSTSPCRGPALASARLRVSICRGGFSIAEHTISPDCGNHVSTGCRA